MNRTRIKEHIITMLKTYYGTGYTITGEYPENADNTAIVVSISGEKPILGKGAGRLSYDFITDKERTLYVTILNIAVTVYAAIDEEAASIAGDIQQSLRVSGNRYINREVGMTDLRDVSGVSVPAMVEKGKRKTWASGVGFNATITEIIET